MQKVFLRSAMALSLFVAIIGAVYALVNAPSNLTVNLEYFSGSYFNADLSWQDNSTNETGFQLYRSNTNNSGSSWVLVSTIAANTTSTTVLLPGYGSGACTNNYYKIRAYAPLYNKKKLVGTEYSAYSNTVNAVNAFSGSTCN